MNALVFTKLSDAQAQQAAVDVALGYPKAGVDVGQGVHAPAAQSITKTWADFVKHPTLEQWAYPVDDVTSAILTKGAVATAATLDASWAPVAIDAVAVDSPQPK